MSEKDKKVFGIVADPEREIFESQMAKEYPDAPKAQIDFGYWCFRLGVERYKPLWLAEQAKAMTTEAELELRK
jgi:hypothetical protein